MQTSHIGAAATKSRESDVVSIYTLIIVYKSFALTFKSERLSGHRA